MRSLAPGEFAFADHFEQRFAGHPWDRSSSTLSILRVRRAVSNSRRYWLEPQLLSLDDISCSSCHARQMRKWRAHRYGAACPDSHGILQGWRDRCDDARSSLDTNNWWMYQSLGSRHGRSSRVKCRNYALLQMYIGSVNHSEVVTIIYTPLWSSSRRCILVHAQKVCGHQIPTVKSAQTSYVDVTISFNMV